MIVQGWSGNLFSTALNISLLEITMIEESMMNVYNRSQFSPYMQRDIGMSDHSPQVMGTNEETWFTYVVWKLKNLMSSAHELTTPKGTAV